jgi:diguanylate cyclase (GGDEF)-like protein
MAMRWATGAAAVRAYALLSASLPPRSIAGPLGGEEFAAIVSGPDRQATMAAAEHVRESFAAAARVVDGIQLAATVSIGLAPADDRQADIEALCERADKALYRAKALGRNRVERAVDESVSFVPDASGEAVVTLGDHLISPHEHARRVTRTSAV